MTNPLGSQLGSLYLGGWIADAPTGHDEAFLLLTTDDPRAPDTMPLVAEVLGVTDRPGAPVTEPETTVSLGGDGWITLHTPGGETLTRPVGAEWREIARGRGRVVLVVGTAPMPAGMSEDTYTAQHAGACRIGIVPVV